MYSQIPKASQSGSPGRSMLATSSLCSAAETSLLVTEMERRLAAPEASLDAPVPGDEDGARTRLDFVPSEDARPDQAVEDNEIREKVREAMAEFATTLSGREADIFAGRFQDPPLTLQELGDKYGISRERARQLEKRMLDRARKFLEARGIDVTAIAMGD